MGYEWLLTAHSINQPQNCPSIPIAYGPSAVCRLPKAAAFTVQQPAGVITSAASLPTGGLLATASRKSAYLWDTRMVSSNIASDSGGGLAAAGSSSGGKKLGEVPTTSVSRTSSSSSKPLLTLAEPERRSLRSVHLDCHKVVAASEQRCYSRCGAVSVWSTSSGAPLNSIPSADEESEPTDCCLASEMAHMSLSQPPPAPPAMQAASSGGVGDWDSDSYSSSGATSSSDSLYDSDDEYRGMLRPLPLQNGVTALAVDGAKIATASTSGTVAFRDYAQGVPPASQYRFGELPLYGDGADSLGALPSADGRFPQGSKFWST